MMKKTKRSSEGFTLVELLIAVMILGFTLIGLVQVFLQCSALSELSRDKLAAMSLLQGKMEEIRNHTFDDIVSDYASGGTPGNTFDLAPLDGMGVIYIEEFTAGDPDLLVVKIEASWETREGRIIGGDLDLDGEIDAGEEVDAEGDLASIAVLQSFIANRL